MPNQLNQHARSGQLAAIQLIINAGAGKSAHVVFRFRRRRKTSLAGEFKILPVSEVDMSLPGPRIGFAIFSEHSDEGLIAVRIGNLVPGSFFIIVFHRNQFSWWQPL